MLLTILTFIILLSILIFVHELGHFLAARKVGVRIEEFAFGLPFTKPLISKVYKGIKLSIYPILFGGFVKLYGEEEQDFNYRHAEFISASKSKSKGIPKQVRDDSLKTTFFAKTKLQRTFVILSGVAMNFLLGVLVISFIFTQGVWVPQPGVLITKILKNSPAQIAGLKENDVIISVDSQKINSPDELVQVTKTKLGKTMILTIKRKEKAEVLGGSTSFKYPTPIKKIVKPKAKQVETEKTINLKIIPRLHYPKNEGPMGIGINYYFLKKQYPIWKAPILGTLEAFSLSWQILSGFGKMVWEIITLARPPADVAGPLGIAQLTGEAVKYGYLAVLQLLAILSLNLAVVNALPLPALDGGRLIFIMAESLFGRKVKPKVEQFLNNLGMAFLLTLVVIITINDLNRLLNLQQILGKIIKISK